MKPHVLKQDYQPENFEFSVENQGKIPGILAKYPEGKQQSAVMPLLDLAQRQMAQEGANQTPPHGGWIPTAAMDTIAEIIGCPKIKVYEVATFYSMYKLAPVGKYLVQICGTTPCWLCGAADIKKACEEHLGIKIGQTSDDGLFTLEEVECLGACVNAPMVQINDDYYEDLTAERMKEMLSLLSEGKEAELPKGSQTGRKGSQAITGPTTLETVAQDS